MKSFLEGFATGGVIVFIIYHFGLQPFLQRKRDEWEASLKTRFEKTPPAT